ncbi:MAG: prolyl-tRNA synthetase, prolyl-tRNA synthetase [Candidatus Peregrinibacteria bacterium GW2011_GWF2_43_17]|nr:MAG: prolyl-tRNA synthetase, prolyl-tRNA synthetase [Candidatus Peregrinibacteria bacterium GW2011_GWF2_43_17]KKT19807.1 MAG: Proline-tRNA ligase [Candidatus Peregrinibacteria bacterium GW2011_GWA2_43_8]HAU39818.1 proline--tRNA ligase [Candidatus Peregrinibacteria bacterium]
MSKITSQSQDFSQWYLDIVKVAELADYSKVKGCMVIKPYGYAIWENIQRELDSRIKAADVKNVYFPLLIPESFLQREKEHVEGFMPECAVVTHGGGKKLTENLVIRPTSETIMYDTFSDWIKSYRDLPLKINQWANIVRWEMRTRPFLRTTEFLWQEGHTAHKDKAGADEEAHRALKMYEDFDRDFLALPVLTGRKSDKEKFAGALYTLSTEALAKDGKAIQAGTSHNLGMTFAESFNINYQDENGALQKVWQTSWGVSTRLIGTLIVVHGDEKGLRLPPKVAPTQVVIVPIYKTDGEERETVLKAARQIASDLKRFRVLIDERDTYTPGFKFTEWEVKGVPLRIEIGPRDLAKNSCILARRDTSEKTSLEISELFTAVPKLLDQIQENMYEQALKFREEMTSEIGTYEDFKKILEEKGGFLVTGWCGKETCEQKIQEETKATIRVIKEENTKCKCVYCGEKSSHKVYFARAY